jgi:hypothetical protein
VPRSPFNFQMTGAQNGKMGGIAIPVEVREVLESPKYLHLAALRADGPPRSCVVWAGIEEERPLICTDDSTWKTKDMRRDPRVSASVVDLANPYRMAPTPRTPSSTRSCRGRARRMGPQAFLDNLGMMFTRWKNQAFYGHVRV